MYAKLAELARAHGNRAWTTADGAVVVVEWTRLDGTAGADQVTVRTVAELAAVLGY